MTPKDVSERVRDRAYFLWEAAGRPSGREHEFWAQASEEIEGERAEIENRDQRSIAR